MRRAVFKYSVFCLAFSFSTAAFAQEVNHVVVQPGAPVKVIELEAEFKGEGKDFLGNYSPDRIDIDIKFENVAEARVHAVRFGVISYNVFDEFMSRRTATSTKNLDPAKDRELRWQSFPPRTEAFTFLTGIVYVDTVRFANGEIWRVDQATLAQQISDLGIIVDEAHLTYEEAPQPFTGEQ
ncbi:MAG: hypothetical protein GKS06_15830 [Acidobacteria bacterium]|nr:hypothetical protein [Acidobacteriota bacterium]